MERLIRKAARMRQKHCSFGKPMIYSQGFKEANIAHDVTATFRSAGYYIFPEFPIQHGSIDAIFIRNREIIICEWKRLHPRSRSSILEQTKRMLEFDPAIQLSKFGFPKRQWQTRYLWICDCWDQPSLDWWFGLNTESKTPWPFNKWICGRFDFSSFGKDWSLYSWVWAFL